MGNTRILRKVSRSGFDGPRLEKAVTEFLLALGVDSQSPHFLETPRRVAEVWAEEFAAGLGAEPKEILGERFSVSSQDVGLLVLGPLRFHGMCPHHLLPYEGEAHLAYLPKSQMVGLGRLSALLNCYAHRLLLQEEVAAEVAMALKKYLGSRATACILKARHSCVRLRGEKQRDAVCYSESYTGLLKKDGSLRRELWARIGGS